MHPLPRYITGITGLVCNEFQPTSRRGLILQAYKLHTSSSVSHLTAVSLFCIMRLLIALLVLVPGHGLQTAEEEGQANVPFRNESQENNTSERLTTEEIETTENSTPGNIMFEDFVSLTTENLTQCFQKSESLAVNAMSGMISFSREGGNGPRAENCTILLTAPPEMMLEINFVLNASACYNLQLGLYGERSFFKQYVCPAENTDVVTGGNIVEVRIVYRKLLQAPVELVFNFTAFAPLHLEVHFTSATTGEGVKKKKSTTHPPHPPQKKKREKKRVNSLCLL